VFNTPFRHLRVLSPHGSDRNHSKSLMILSENEGRLQALSRFVSDRGCHSTTTGRGGPLRKAALDRKNFLFVGHEAAGENLAGLYALVATCEANDVNPEESLADVLLRVQTPPAHWRAAALAHLQPVHLPTPRLATLAEHASPVRILSQGK